MSGEKRQIKIKGARALGARVKNSRRTVKIDDNVIAVYPVTGGSATGTDLAGSDGSDISFDPYEHMTDAVVDMAKNGELEFLDPLSSLPDSMKSEFDQIFTHHMMIEFGTENGVFLLERHRAGKVSPKLKKQIEAIREYTAGVFRRKHLASNSMVLDAVADLYRKVYDEGGLNKVDEVITMLNEKLGNIGSRFGIGPGTACMEGDNGTTEWIAVIFCELESEEFISLEWCHLMNTAPI